MDTAHMDEDREEKREASHFHGAVNSYCGIECSFSDRRESMPIKITNSIFEKATAWFQKEHDLEWPLRILACELPNVPTELPFSQPDIEAVSGPERTLYSGVWDSETGGTNVSVGSPIKFIAQTPNDNGPFCSLALTTTSHGRGTVCGLYCFTDPIYDCSELLKNRRLYSGWRSGGWQILLLPVAFLLGHVIHKRKEIAQLNKRVADIENIATQPRDPQADDNLDFAKLTRTLQECQSELFRLERRAKFESNVAKNIATLLAAAEKAQASCIGFIQEPLDLALNMMDVQSYDLQALPKRIESQRIMIFNLILQRDSQMNLQIGRTNMEIADTSRRIAEATMRDSASMKTIAILTMVFLPGTAVASFFSIGMFNWNAKSDESLASSWIWVYFVTSIPLTIAVLAVWYFTLRRRGRRLYASEILLAPHSTGFGEASNIDKV